MKFIKLKSYRNLCMITFLYLITILTPLPNTNFFHRNSKSSSIYIQNLRIMWIKIHFRMVCNVACIPLFLDFPSRFTPVNLSCIFDIICRDESSREEKDYGYQTKCWTRGWDRSALANPRAISEAHLPLLAFVARGSAESLAKRAILCGLVRFSMADEVFYYPFVAIYLHSRHAAPK